MKRKKIIKKITQSGIYCRDYINDKELHAAIFRLGMKEGVKKEHKRVKDWITLLDYRKAEFAPYPECRATNQVECNPISNIAGGHRENPEYCSLKEKCEFKAIPNGLPACKIIIGKCNFDKR